MKLALHNPVKYGFNLQDPPEHVQSGYFTPSFDNRLWMFHRKWEPDGIIVATLMIVHGTVDHSGVYETLASELIKKGIAVIGMDMRGWGYSDGESMYISDMDTSVEDLYALYKTIHNHERYLNVKARFLLGKSLGGTVTAFAVAKYPTAWTGLLGLSG